MSASEPAPVIIYTDGACLRNPGPGGYGVVILSGGERRELSGGFRRTTNNRMELMAAIEGLEALDAPSTVTLYTDSQYLANGMERGWAKRWRANGWRKSDKEPALNADLWSRLLDLADRHRVRFEWLRGHAGDKENERCDRLSVQAAQRQGLPVDPGYENPSRGNEFTTETRRHGEDHGESRDENLILSPCPPCLRGEFVPPQSARLDALPEVERADARTTRGYRELPVWQAGVDLAVNVCRLAGAFPAEDADLAVEMRRVAVAIPSHVAEGYTADNPDESRRHVSLACGAAAALETRIEIAARLGCVPPEEVSGVQGQIAGLRAQLQDLNGAMVGGDPWGNRMS